MAQSLKLEVTLGHWILLFCATKNSFPIVNPYRVSILFGCHLPSGPRSQFLNIQSFDRVTHRLAQLRRLRRNNGSGLDTSKIKPSPPPRELPAFSRWCRYRIRDEAHAASSRASDRS